MVWDADVQNGQTYEQYQQTWGAPAWETAFATSKQQVKTRVPKYDSNGKLLGYTVTVKDGWGNKISETFDASGADTTDTTERTLAADTFKNTLSLLFGTAEANKPYVTELYKMVSGFYKSGSTVDEALNLSIRQARDTNTMPEFTKRFAGIFALEDKLKAGQAVQVPTIAEFFAAEAKMGEVLTNAGLGDLATQDFLGSVIGKGKSVLEVGNLISDVFTTIDNAPEALKTDLATYFPGVDRVSIAKALLTGEQGAQELSKKVQGISVMSAARQQGVTVGLTAAQDIANQGYNYQQAMAGFGEVKQLERANTLAQFKGGQFTQQQAQGAVFGQSIEQKNILEQLKQEESARFKGSSGTLGSKSLASQQRGAGLI